MAFNGHNNGFNNGFNIDPNLIAHFSRFLGQTVTVFTTSGGASGCGFTGVLLAVHCDYLRLTTQEGQPPANPLSESICGDMDNGIDTMGGGISGGIGGVRGQSNNYPNQGCGKGHHNHRQNVGSVVDIPFNKIAAFCHNAI